MIWYVPFGIIHYVPPMGRSKRDLVRPMGGTELYLLIFKELYAGDCVQVLFNGLMLARQNHAALRAWIIGWEVPLWQRVSLQLEGGAPHLQY